MSTPARRPRPVTGEEGEPNSTAVVPVTSVLGAALGAAGLIVASLDSDVGVILALCGLVVVIGGVVVSRRRAGWWVCAAAVMVSGWDGVSIGPVNVPDLGLVLAVFAAACTLGRSGRLPRPPTALVVAVVAFTLSYLLVLFFPPDAAFVAGRVRPGDVIDLGAAGRVQPGMFGNYLRLLLALVVMPLLVVIFARTRSEARGLASAYVLGALVNGLVSWTDKAHLTHVTTDLRGFLDVEGRQAGLTTHPNQLGLVLAMGLPLAFVVFRRRPTQLLVVAVLLGGVWFSGSRAAQAAGLLAIGLSLVIAGWRLRLAYAVMVAAVGLAASDVVHLTRFGAASQSDYARTAIAAQAVRDFEHSPVWGIGPGVLQDAHVIYLQLLAGAGVLGFLGFALLIGWTLRNSVALRAQPLFAASGASLAVFLVAGIASNALLARYLFVPVGLIWAGTLLTPTPDSVENEPVAVKTPL